VTGAGPIPFVLEFGCDCRVRGAASGAANPQAGRFLAAAEQLAGGLPHHTTGRACLSGLCMESLPPPAAEVRACLSPTSFRAFIHSVPRHFVTGNAL
jgi:hypothetical protein